MHKKMEAEEKGVEKEKHAGARQAGDQKRGQWQGAGDWGGRQVRDGGGGRELHDRAGQADKGGLADVQHAGARNLTGGVNEPAYLSMEIKGSKDTAREFVKGEEFMAR